MAIKIQGTTVIDDSRNVVNILGITATTVNATTANFSGTSAIQLPSGTTNQQPQNPTAGLIRFNTDLGYVEFFDGIAWSNVDKFITGRMYFLGTNG